MNNKVIIQPLISFGGIIIIEMERFRCRSEDDSRSNLEVN